MKVEIVFQSNSTPAVYEADDVYTKGSLLCMRSRKENMVVKFPLCNIFSVAHEYFPMEDTATDKVAEE